MSNTRRILVVTSITCALTGGATASALAGSGDASTSASRVLLVSNCNKAKFKPPSVVLTCGDAGLIAKGLTWSEWTGKSASGEGTGIVETCVPDCATGGTRRGAIELTARRPQLCSNGQRVFSKLHYTWTDGAPKGPDGKPVGPDSGSVPLGCKLLGG